MSSPSLLSWITSHTRLYEYSELVSYRKEDIVTIRNSVYQSVYDNNLNNNPKISNKWIKLV
jgi:hypothetical protein